MCRISGVELGVEYAGTSTSGGASGGEDAPRPSSARRRRSWRSWGCRRRDGLRSARPCAPPCEERHPLQSRRRDPRRYRRSASASHGVLPRARHGGRRRGSSGPRRRSAAKLPARAPAWRTTRAGEADPIPCLRACICHESSPVSAVSHRILGYLASRTHLRARLIRVFVPAFVRGHAMSGAAQGISAYGAVCERDGPTCEMHRAPRGGGVRAWGGATSRSEAGSARRRRAVGASREAQHLYACPYLRSTLPHPHPAAAARGGRQRSASLDGRGVVCIPARRRRFGRRRQTARARQTLGAAGVYVSRLRARSRLRRSSSRSVDACGVGVADGGHPEPQNGAAARVRRRSRVS
ncbi:hypothetical protein B0H17DRAFT_4510 [Mycena rosella]|uniref:Uncharacterized protein n=1 Tax=Mycena rosella TaxID=1033263 RepID=A0AAD7H2I6_MYCRO|nr:hypothetical protein B0H17DRAFT_4510 [Mycena rosella]